MSAYAGAVNGMNDGVSVAGGQYVDAAATSEERTYATLMSLIPLLTLTAAGWLVALIAVVVMWRVRASSAFIDDHGKEVTNFMISLGIWFVGLIVAGIVLSIATLGLGMLIAIPIGIVLYVTGAVIIVVGSIRGAMAANAGRYHRFPATFRVIG